MSLQYGCKLKYQVHIIRYTLAELKVAKAGVHINDVTEDALVYNSAVGCNFRSC